jgi:hypothetical protein
VSENVFFVEKFLPLHEKKISSRETNLFLKCSEKKVTTSDDDTDVGEKFRETSIVLAQCADR